MLESGHRRSTQGAHLLTKSSTGSPLIGPLSVPKGSVLKCTEKTVPEKLAGSGDRAPCFIETFCSSNFLEAFYGAESWARPQTFQGAESTFLKSMLDLGVPTIAQQVKNLTVVAQVALEAWV